MGAPRKPTRPLKPPQITILRHTVGIILHDCVLPGSTCAGWHSPYNVRPYYVMPYNVRHGCCVSADSTNSEHNGGATQGQGDEDDPITQGARRHRTAVEAEILPLFPGEPGDDGPASGPHAGGRSVVGEVDDQAGADAAHVDHENRRRVAWRKFLPVDRTGRRHDLRGTRPAEPVRSHMPYPG